MDYLPVFFNIKNKPCLIVGGGVIASRKIDLLLKANARVTVIAPSACDAVKTLYQKQKLSWINRPFQKSDLEGMTLVICATDQEPVNRQVSEQAHKLGIPVNVVDNPDLCSFIVPSIIDRSPIIAAVSSSGSSPVLSKLIRTKIETLLPPQIGKLALLAQRYRNTVKQKIKDQGLRRNFWERVLNGRVSDLVFSGQDKSAEETLIAQLEANEEPFDKLQTGQVALVGAGPGDPDLLTLRAMRLLQEADVVIYDRLVAEQILNLIRKDAEKIYAGKARNNHSMPQDEINHLLSRLARQGKKVVRLKGGDPFIFGRGGEEIETLMEQGIPFQVVPGITAASGCANYAGIPLTHRDHAQYCTFITGHLKDGSINLPWEQLALPQQTLVIYMGLLSCNALTEELIKRGRSKDLPAAIIEQGTTPDQKVFVGTLETLPEIIASNDIRSPCLIIIGNVVKLHKKLSWYKTAS